MRTRRYWYVIAAALIGCAAPGEGPGPGASPDGGQAAEPREATPLEQGLDLDAIGGNLRLYLTDAPVDLDEVWVEVSRVEISTSSGDDSWVSITEEPVTLDLLTLQDAVTAVLGDAELAPGAYQQIRFVVAEAWAVSDGETRPLRIPSGEQTGIKINLDFEVEADTVYAVVLDFDAAESIHETGNGTLMMGPVIKVAYIGVVEDETVEPVGEEPAAEEDGGVEPEPEPDAGPSVD